MAIFATCITSACRRIGRLRETFACHTSGFCTTFNSRSYATPFVISNYHIFLKGIMASEYQTHQLYQQVAHILQLVKTKITEDSNFTWIPYDNSKDLNEKIDQIARRLYQADKTALDELQILFLPTATYQEHSISNG